MTNNQFKKEVAARAPHHDTAVVSDIVNVVFQTLREALTQHDEPVSIADFGTFKTKLIPSKHAYHFGRKEMFNTDPYRKIVFTPKFKGEVR